MKNSVILFYKNNLNIYMVILSDVDNLTLGKIISFLLSYYGCSIKTFDYTLNI